MNKKKRITAALDNFPAGKVLVVLVVIVVILQSYSAWKVIGLEGERVSLQRDIENFKEMTNDIPQLRKQRDQLTKEVYELDGMLKRLEIDWSNISKKVDDGKAIIEQSKKAESIRNDLEIAVRDLNQAIQTQTEEIKRMTGPTSKLSGTLDKLDEAPRKIDRALEAVSSVSADIRKSSQAMQAQVKDIQVSLNRSIEVHNKADRVSIEASGKVSEAGASIIKATKLLNENAAEFRQASEDVNKSTDNVKESTRRLEKITDDVQQAGNKARNAIESFDSIKRDLLNVVRDIKDNNATAIKSMNRDIENIQKSSGKLSDIVEKIKLHTKDFNDRISEIQPSKYDRALSKHSDDIMEAAKTAGEIETQLKKLIDSIQSLTDESIGEFESLQQELESAKKRISKIKDPVNNEN